MKNSRTGPAVLAVEVDRVAPIGVMLLREIVGGELAQVIADGPKMVVDHVQNHAQAEPVGRSTKRRKSSGVPYSRVGANRSTPS